MAAAKSVHPWLHCASLNDRPAFAAVRQSADNLVRLISEPIRAACLPMAETDMPNAYPISALGGLADIPSYGGDWSIFDPSSTWTRALCRRREP